MFPLALALVVLGIPLVQATVWNVTVGAGGQLRYSPENITAIPGDVVLFIFNPVNHTATQSAFGTPCVPLEGGFDSGFHPVSSTDETSSFEVPITETDPIWVYCRQKGHCGQGMVFSINAVSDSNHSFAAFQNLAIQQNGTVTSAAGTSTSVSVTASSSNPVNPPSTTSATSSTTFTSTTNSKIDSTTVQSSSSATTTSSAQSASNTGSTGSAQSLTHAGSVGVGAMVGVLTLVATGFALVL